MISKPSLAQDFAVKEPVPWSYEVEVREEVEPSWPFRLRGRSMDGLYVRRGQSLQRLIHLDGRPVHLGVVVLPTGRVLIAARSATEELCAAGLKRARFALSIDDDLSEFYETYRDDPLIGKAVRTHPGRRIGRHPVPWESFAWAVTEQLIEVEEAVAIQRRMIWKLGRHCPVTNLRDSPSAVDIAAVAPAVLESCGLSHSRSIAMRRAAREVVAGRIDLGADDHETTWRRLREIPTIGRWTTEKLATHGQGRYDQVPAADLAYLKAVGRYVTGRPKARADEATVREVLEPYGKWKGLAGSYFLYASKKGLLPDLKG